MHTKGIRSKRSTQSFLRMCSILRCTILSRCSGVRLCIHSRNLVSRSGDSFCQRSRNAWHCSEESSRNSRIRCVTNFRSSGLSLLKRTIRSPASLRCSGLMVAHFAAPLLKRSCRSGGRLFQRSLILNSTCCCYGFRSFQAVPSAAVLIETNLVISAKHNSIA